MKKILQSICYPIVKPKDISFEIFFKEVRRIGYEGIEMWEREQDFEEVCRVAKIHGLKVVGMVGHQMNPGFNDRKHHAENIAQLRESLEIAQKKGIGNLVCFSGNSIAGQSDEDAREAMVEGLKKIAPDAEKAGINLNLELLNSKVDHKGYQCDRTWWAVDVIKRVNSPRVKVLYDIYHMQIMEGDVIRTIRENIQYFGHFHTAGNPGRKDLDDDQELNYSGISKAISSLGYEGFVGHEFFPKGDPIKAMEQAFAICRA